MHGWHCLLSPPIRWPQWHGKAETLPVSTIQGETYSARMISPVQRLDSTSSARPLHGSHLLGVDSWPMRSSQKGRMTMLPGWTAGASWNCGVATEIDCHRDWVATFRPIPVCYDHAVTDSGEPAMTTHISKMVPPVARLVGRNLWWRRQLLPTGPARGSL